MYVVGVLLLGCWVAGSVGSKIAAGRNKDNKKALFIANPERGLCNVVLATAHAMLVDYPEVEIYFASFPALEKVVREISQTAYAQNPAARPILYENISGLSYGDVFVNKGFNIDSAINDPGVRGFSKFNKNFEQFLVPWSGPEYVEIYYDIIKKIKTIDPSVIVLDTTLSPAIDATRDLDRKHVMVSANQLKDQFAPMQPYGEMFWKIPAINSAYDYPVPWYLVPTNIFLSIRLVISALWTPTLSEKRAYIKSQGLKDPANIITSFRKDVPWISPSVPETEYPLVIPDNVVCTGPIYLDQGDVQSRDPSLAAWLTQRPTILINLGSHVTYNESDAVEMVGALKNVLDQTDAQVLWKFNKRKPYSDDFLKPISTYVKNDRLRIQKWITVDIAALLKTGSIAIFVHHGGANSFYEGLATGVPTVVLPLWVDLYDYAVRTEWLGIGLWGSRKTAPAWTATELTETFMKIMGDTEESRKITSKAKEIGELVTKSGGRKKAAEVIVNYMNQVGASPAVEDSLPVIDREL